MTVDEAGRILREMYDAGKNRREAAVTMHLFGIMYADDLDKLGVGSVLHAAGISGNYRGEINKGRNLAKLVALLFRPGQK